METSTDQIEQQVLIHPQTRYRKLEELADACNNGACNIAGIVNGLAAAIQSVSPGELRQRKELPIIIGQISFLLGESLGPTCSAIEAYAHWKRDHEGANTPFISD